MKISEAFRDIEKKNRIRYLTISIDDGAERFFSSNGCDICDNGLGNDVYEAKLFGYIPGPSKTLHCLGEYSICHQCACFSANGEDNKIEGRDDDGGDL